MSKIPSLSFLRIVRAFQREGWTVVRQRGSHIRLQKHIHDEVIKIIVPAHRPVKRSTLVQIFKQARMDLDRFNEFSDKTVARLHSIRSFQNGPIHSLY